MAQTNTEPKGSRREKQQEEGRAKEDWRDKGNRDPVSEILQDYAGKCGHQESSWGFESLQAWESPGASLLNNPPGKQLGTERSEEAVRTTAKGSCNRHGDFCQHTGMSEGSRDPSEESVVFVHRGQRTVSLAGKLQTPLNP